MSTLAKKLRNSPFSGLNGYGIALLALLIFWGMWMIRHSPAVAMIAVSVWGHSVPYVGNSDPLLVDITNDGVLDVIVGAGSDRPILHSASIRVMDGRTGTLVWETSLPHAPSRQPVAMDVTKDGCPDVVVTGNFDDVWVLDGQTGAIVWRLWDANADVDRLPYRFGSPVTLGDIDGDGVDDMAIIQSGLVGNTTAVRVYDRTTGEPLVELYNDVVIQNAFRKVMIGTTNAIIDVTVCHGAYCVDKSLRRGMLMDVDRVKDALFGEPLGAPGRIMVISGTGRVLKTMAIPVLLTSQGDPLYQPDAKRIVYGVGSATTVGQIIAQHVISGTVEWAIPTQKGVVTTPLAMDNWVIATTLNGDMMAIQADTGTIVWQTRVSEHHAFLASSTIRRQGSGWDVVGMVATGSWPQYNGAVMIAVDGQTGGIQFRQRMGSCAVYAAPVGVDLTGDGEDELLQLTCTATNQSQLRILDGDYQPILIETYASNGRATPAVADMDGDGYVDIIVARSHFLNRLYGVPPLDKRPN